MNWESGQGLDHIGHPVGPLLDIILGESLNRSRNAHTWELGSIVPEDPNLPTADHLHGIGNTGMTQQLRQCYPTLQRQP